MSKSANIKLTISYDGTNYLGWQKTQMGPSIEEVLEGVISRVLQHPVNLQAASRTDAGVHAVGQVVNFFTDKAIALDRFKYSLNCLLPKDIAVNTIEEMAADFHPTLNCTSKEYHYRVCYGNIQLPHQRFYEWHYPHELNLNAIQTAIPLLLGKQNFSAFCNVRKNCTYTHYIRNIESITMHELPNECLRFEICGNNFLYKMVRNLVGTLIYIGRGKIGINQIADILADGDRTKAGITAPALGLTLHRVNFG